MNSRNKLRYKITYRTKKVENIIKKSHCKIQGRKMKMNGKKETKEKILRGRK